MAAGKVEPCAEESGEDTEEDKDEYEYEYEQDTLSDGDSEHAYKGEMEEGVITTYSVPSTLVDICCRIVYARLMASEAVHNQVTLCHLAIRRWGRSFWSMRAIVLGSGPPANQRALHSRPIRK